MLVWRRIHWRDRKKCGKTLEWAYQPWCAFGASTPLPPPSKTPLSSFSPTPLLNLRTTFFYCFLSKNFNPLWKMSPFLCSNPLLKFGTLSRRPTFRKFGWRLNPSVVADKLSETDHFAKLALNGVVLLLLNQGNCWNFTPLQ